jgi:hypothetical protein
MPLDNAKIYHGGRAGKGAVGFSAPPDRIIDNNGDLILYAEDGVIYIKAFAGYTSMLFDLNVLIAAGGSFDLSSSGDMTIYSSGGGKGSIGGTSAELASTSGDCVVKTNGGGRIKLEGIRSGATQVAAGAQANEVWRTQGHATLPNNVLMIGV